MTRTVLGLMISALAAVTALAVDGVVLINESTVMAAGGFPYSIAQPGSYRLSGNLTAPVNKDAIHISASNVTLDLNGFTVECSVVVGNVVHCVGVTAGNFNGISIRNGAVSGLSAGGLGSGSGGPFSFIGVDLQSPGSLLQDLRVTVPPFTMPQFGLFAPVTLVARSSFRQNIVSGGFQSFINCPSIVVENIFVTPTFNPNFFGTGCIGYGNVGSGNIP